MIPPGVLALGSAVLLVLSFPNCNQPWCAWVALVPWLVLLRRAAAREAFWWSYAIGVAFFLGSMWWLTHVTFVGLLVLCVYLALYFAAFGLITQRVLCHHPSPITHHLVVIPSIWVAMEFLRSHVLSGLGWNLLAYSQSPWRSVIQIADMTGAWGVSFLIVLVNVALAGLPGFGRRTARSWLALPVAAGCVAGVLGYAVWRVPQVGGGQIVRVAVVQGNVPQDEKWDAAFVAKILDHYETLTRTAAATQPALIVWPETSVPGYLGIDEAITQRMTRLARTVQRPLLVGSPVPTLTGGRVTLMNSAMLIDDAGQFAGRYDKLHLVPFGEFVPFEQAVPWLRTILPPIGEFSPGHEYTVFTLPVKSSEFRVASSNSQPATHNSQLRFSVLICFEDMFPEMARRFVRQGARLLLVITNDAWFGPTAAAYQHAQASAFRAVELRVPMARAANTGWSGCIDPTGRWIGGVRQAQTGAELFVDGTHTCELPLGGAASAYLRWGDWFALLCLFGSLGWSVTQLRTGRHGAGSRAHG